MKKLFITLIGIAASLTANGQGYFNRLYEADKHLLASSVVETNGGYFVVGQMPSVNDRKMIFYKLNYFGDTLFQRTYGNQPDVYYPIKLLRHGANYLVAGAVYKDTTAAQNSDIFMALFDNQAELIWIKYYGGPLFDNLSSIEETPEKGYILAGSYKHVADSLPDFYLFKTDSLGNVLWEKTYGSPGKIEAADAVTQTADGGYLLVGSNFVPPSAPVFGNYDLMVIKTDSLGNQEWLKTFGTDQNDNGGAGIELADKSFLVATGLGSLTQQKESVMLKLDSMGQLLWQKKFPGQGYSTFSIPIVKHLDQTYTFCGIVTNTQNTAVGFITKIDIEGNEIWRREYETRSDIDQYIYDLKATSDGGYVFCGSAFDDTSNVQRAWVVKLDCFGCDSLLCYYPDSLCTPSVAVPEMLKMDAAFRCYPNPNNGTFTIQNPIPTPVEAVLYDLNGRVLWRQSIDGQSEINTDLPAGSYTIAIPQWAWNQRLVIE